MKRACNNFTSKKITNNEKYVLPIKFRHMKSIQFIYSVIVLTIILSCSSNDETGNNNNDILNNYTTECNGTIITGPMAAYWDSSKGILIPLTQLPLLANPGPQYIHSQYPALGFPLPNSYNGFDALDQEIPGAQGTIGVNVVRNDNAVVWRYAPTYSFFGNFSVTNAVANEVNLMFNFYGFNGSNFEVICSETFPENLGGGITRVYSARLIRFGNFTGQVYIIATLVDGLPGSTFVSSSVTAGPTNEYNNLVGSIFLPLNFQLLINDNGLLDSDLDGTPDVNDPAPNDPAIP